METREYTDIDAGCYLSNSRGHYMSRDVIQFAVSEGYIIGLFEQWAVETYDDHSHTENYPVEAIIELCDDAIDWLNSGQDDCPDCNGTGLDPEGWVATDGSRRCKTCTGTGRGPRIAGQNFPPRIPDGYEWAMWDGDFGLYEIERDEA